MADYADMKAAVAAADTLEAKQAAATNASNAMSQKVYNTTLKMYNKLQAKTAARHGSALCCTEALQRLRRFP